LPLRIIAEAFRERRDFLTPHVHDEGNPSETRTVENDTLSGILRADTFRPTGKKSLQKEGLRMNGIPSRTN
jgi:hypothetical protein